MTMPDLVVVLADGRTFTRRPPAAEFPPNPRPDDAAWARFLAGALEVLLANADKGDTMESTAKHWAARDFASNALLGWWQWSETGPGWVDQ